MIDAASPSTPAKPPTEGRKHDISLAETLSCLWADARRKRVQMGKSTGFRSVAASFLSINVVVLVIFRFSMYLQRKGWKLPSMALYYLNIVLFGFDASPYSSIGPGLVVVHVVGCVIHAKIGKNCTLFGRNGIGGKGKGDTGGWLGGPIIGDGVTLGFGACILSDASIGDNAFLGAGSWCFGPVEANTTVVGVPARVVRS